MPRRAKKFTAGNLAESLFPTGSQKDLFRNNGNAVAFALQQCKSKQDVRR
jgi:hypothetical protein